MRSRHTDEEKATICAFAVEHGPAAASRKFGVNKHTVGAWMRRSGMHADARMQTENLRRATQAAALTRQERVATLAGTLLRIAEDRSTAIADGTLDPQTQVKLMTVAAIAIDKSQLLAGAATARTELTGDAGTARQEVAEMADELAVRRARRSQVA